MSKSLLPRRIDRSVRAKLLMLVLAPLLVGLPLLLGLAWTWGDEAYHRLLSFKIGSDLVTAHEYFDRVRQDVGHELQALAASVALDRLLTAPTALATEQALHRMAVARGLDYLHLLDRDGVPLASAGGHRLPPQARDGWSVVASATAGSPRTAIELFTPDELAAIDPALRRRAHLPLVDTPAAVPESREFEDRGMMIHAAAPVFDADGRRVALLEGGVMLNGNLAIVDRINTIVYREGSLPLGSVGTATIFLGDTRIATNVRLFEGTRALGTRVSRAVREHVLEGGHVWQDTAFVVNDYYVSGYEPIEDSGGNRIGMLYVGFLEAPFRDARTVALGTLFAVFVAISVTGAVLSLRFARTVFRPIERMNAVIQRVASGEADARVGAISSRDELGRLAGEFDWLLDTLAQKRAELQRWADQLDSKVAERTAELAEANAILHRARQQLVMSEKLAAIGELTAGVAHEINNPVAVIQGNLDVLDDVLGGAAEPVRREIRLIHQQADRIRQIVTKLLQFARPGEFAGYVEEVEINALLADCVVLTRHNIEKRRIELEQRLDAGLRVEINRSELQQVLINLIVNAVQAMPEGGRLLLASEDWIEEGVPRGASIRVRDSGQGIAREHLDRIFDPFFTTKKGSGTGLGLSISYTIVQRYGGRITVSSEVGKGAEFRVWLRRQAVFDEAPNAPEFRARWAAGGGDVTV